MKQINCTLLLLAFLSPIAAGASVTIDGKEYRVFDPHLHFGSYAQMNTQGKSFIIGGMPEFSRLYSPPALDLAVDPYDPHVGIAAQMEMAGIDGGIILAVYTHHTTGYATNFELKEQLLDERNTAADGSPLFHGMVSINFDDFSQPAIVTHRLAAVRSYFAIYPELIVGIKLAHAHQGVAFDDEHYHGIYDIAAEFDVPVLLHTGFSPAPNSMDQPNYYDPIHLQSTIEKYNGEDGKPLVVFIFAHAGQGDARSVNHSLELCRDHDNVYLDLSALKRPFKIDIDGNPISEEDQQLDEFKTQLPYVLAKIREFDLFSRVFFATDGAQYSGFLRSYLTYFIEQMQLAQFSEQEMQQVLYDNSVELLLGK